MIATATKRLSSSVIALHHPHAPARRGPVLHAAADTFAGTDGDEKAAGAASSSSDTLPSPSPSVGDEDAVTAAAVGDAPAEEEEAGAVTPAPAPSPVSAFVPATYSTPPPGDVEEVEEDPDAEERAVLVRRLLGLAAASSRGQQESRDGRATMEGLITNLEFMNPTEEPARGIDGEWVLVYANVEAFRSSPFFWAFQKVLPGGEELAAQIFKFTAGLPVAGARGPFGVIAQTVSLETEELVSEVEMRLFDPFFALASGMSGTVVSTASVKVAEGSDGDTLLVTPRTTRVRNSNVGGALLDQVVVPTSDVLTQAAGGSAAVEAEVTVTYVDSTLQVMRVGENRDQIFVYAKRSEIF